MSKKIKVLISVGSLGIGGNEQFCMNLYRHINRDKFDVDFVVFDDQRLDHYQEVISSGSKVYFCNSHNSLNKFLNAIEEGRKVKKILDENHYDIIHCNSCSFFGILRSAIPGKLTKGTKVIGHAHNPGMPKNTIVDNLERGFLKWLTSRTVDYGFSCSDVASKSKYTDKFIESSRHYIINNAIETERFLFSEQTRSDIRKKYSIPDNSIVIGHIGRLEQQKNHMFLLEIFSEVLKVNPDSRLLLVGDGSLKDKLTAKADKLGISDRVIFAGYQSHAEQFYNAMDCMVMPSYYEGFPFVVVEGQINGVKCLLSDRVTQSANITGDVYFMSLNKAPKEWALKVIQLSSARISQYRIDKVINQYDVSYETRYIEQLYEKLLKNKEIIK